MLQMRALTTWWVKNYRPSRKARRLIKTYFPTWYDADIQLNEAKDLLFNLDRPHDAYALFTSLAHTLGDDLRYPTRIELQYLLTMTALLLNKCTDAQLYRSMFKESLGRLSTSNSRRLMYIYFSHESEKLEQEYEEICANSPYVKQQ